MPVLNDSQKDRISETFANIGLIFFASMVVPFFTAVEEIDTFKIVSGAIATTCFIFASLVVLKEVD